MTTNDSRPITLPVTSADLKAIHDRACVLRNTSPGFEEDGETPTVRYLYECEESGHTHTSGVHHCPPPKGYSYAGCILLVGAGCEMLTVATNEGEQMPDVAEAIAAAGADIFALIARVKELEAAAPAVKLTGGWRFLCGIASSGVLTEITAAEPCDGIGVVATWKVFDGAWVLTGWGCDEDRTPEENSENPHPIPNAPPLVMS